MPTPEEGQRLFDRMADESDRGFAIMAASFAETGLLWAILRRLPDGGPDVRSQTFEAAGAPLASFSAKIIMGRALGVYGPVIAKELNQVRTLRNAFAHSLKPIDFSHPTIVRETAKLSLLGYSSALPQHDTPRNRYKLATSYLYATLMVDAQQERAPIVTSLP
jgi:hypothetical protein